MWDSFIHNMEIMVQCALFCLLFWGLFLGSLLTGADSTYQGEMPQSGRGDRDVVNGVDGEGDVSPSVVQARRLSYPPSAPAGHLPHPLGPAAISP